MNLKGMFLKTLFQACMTSVIIYAVGIGGVIAQTPEYTMPAMTPIEELTPEQAKEQLILIDQWLDNHTRQSAVIGEESEDVPSNIVPDSDYDTVLTYRKWLAVKAEKIKKK